MSPYSKHTTMKAFYVCTWRDYSNYYTYDLYLHSSGSVKTTVDICQCHHASRVLPQNKHWSPHDATAQLHVPKIPVPVHKIPPTPTLELLLPPLPLVASPEMLLTVWRVPCDSWSQSHVSLCSIATIQVPSIESHIIHASPITLGNALTKCTHTYTCVHVGLNRTSGFTHY